MFSVTITIISVTVFVSFIAFRNRQLMDNLIFNPVAVTEKNQYYRFITCGFIHADIPHLFFNMLTLYFFGEGENKRGVEYIFQAIFGEKGKLLYLLMYLLALAVCIIPTFEKNKTNPNYRSLGASGATSAVVFAYIIFNPLSQMGLVFIPVYAAGFVFGILFLLISYFLDKQTSTNINHSAHIWGAVFGVIFVIVVCKLFSNYPVFDNFIQTVRNMDLRKIFTVY